MVQLMKRFDGRMERDGIKALGRHYSGSDQSSTPSSASFSITVDEFVSRYKLPCSRFAVLSCAFSIDDSRRKTLAACRRLHPRRSRCLSYRTTTVRTKSGTESRNRIGASNSKENGYNESKRRSTDRKKLND